jgi:hypothetical protein
MGVPSVAVKSVAMARVAPDPIFTPRTVTGEPELTVTKMPLGVSSAMSPPPGTELCTQLPALVNEPLDTAFCQ